MNLAILGLFLAHLRTCLADFDTIIERGQVENATLKVTALVMSLDVSNGTATAITTRVKEELGLSSISRIETQYEQEVIGNVQLSCWVIKACLGEDIVKDGSLLAEIEINWSQSCWQTPGCFISPRNAADVSKTIKILTFFGTPFAIRSGGHSPNPGWASIDEGGVLIDLGNLNSIKLSSDSKVASIGPGSHWGAVYNFLDPFGVTVVGGRIPQVGVGGLLLGGGLSHFSSQFGLAADNVKNYEVVLSDGSIIGANAQENSDLFWALKGGGPNFGIVTRFDLYTVPIDKIWYSAIVYSSSDVPQLLSAFVRWQNEGSLDTKSSVIFQIGLDVCSVGLVYSEPANLPLAFAPFYNITPLAVPISPTNGSISSLSDILGGAFTQVLERHDYRAASSLIDLEPYTQVEAQWRKQAAAIQTQTGANTTFTLQHISKDVVSQGLQKGGNALGLSPVLQQWWTTVIDWQNEDQDDAVRDSMISVTDTWKELGTARGSYLENIFMNDASRDQNPLFGYGPSNLARLRSIALKYDPSKVFQVLQNDGFLLSKA
ncbi:hypothetical protein G7Y89_g12485 [Cudoniella acicularis]|uniref:FAD-binding PCMH-type domain-containing protein n=1 Tax=Cudoniella acicularis TaxID=354080 RepID=A0A8H4RAC3_9HELO|nr:hypothetical protein G7Y89_g12485 [Cudoniella acicularis]